MKILVAYDHSWGKGKTHVRAKERVDSGLGMAVVPICNKKGIYAHEEEGTMSDVTCKLCLRIVERHPDLVSA